MTYARPTFDSDLLNLPQMPPWVTSARSDVPEDVAFLSGAALNHLHLVLEREEVPQALLRDKLARQSAHLKVLAPKLGAKRAREYVATLPPRETIAPVTLPMLDLSRTA